jgi:hypothetical protein
MRKVKFVSSNDRAVLLALEDAAQEIADKVALLREVLREDALAEMQALTESEYSTDALVCLSETHQQLDAVLAEKSEEYELIGRIHGTLAGRWTLIVDNKAALWPDNTAVYVRRIKR